MQVVAGGWVQFVQCMDHLSNPAFIGTIFLLDKKLLLLLTRCYRSYVVWRHIVPLSVIDICIVGRHSDVSPCTVSSYGTLWWPLRWPLRCWYKFEVLSHGAAMAAKQALQMTLALLILLEAKIVPHHECEPFFWHKFGPSVWLIIRIFIHIHYVCSNLPTSVLQPRRLSELLRSLYEWNLAHKITSNTFKNSVAHRGKSRSPLSND